MTPSTWRTSTDRSQAGDAFGVIVADMAAAGLGPRLGGRQQGGRRRAPGWRSPPTTGRRPRRARRQAGDASTGRPAARPGPGRCRPTRLIVACIADRPAGSAPGTGVRISSAGRDGGQRHLDADRRGGPLAHHQSLEQGVRREPVRAVQSGPGDLAHREQAGDRGAPVQIGQHAAAVVVRGRGDRDRVGRRVDAGQRAGRRHRRETAGEDRGRDAGRVQEHMIGDTAG